MIKMVDPDVAAKLIESDVDDRTHFFGYYKVGELIAVIGYYKTKIKYWYVKPEYRKKGYGTEMLKYVLLIDNRMELEK